MSKENQINITEHITPAQAKKSISEMNLINGFLFDSALENEDEAKIIVGNILEDEYLRSMLYHPAFETEFRKAEDSK